MSSLILRDVGDLNDLKMDKINVLEDINIDHLIRNHLISDVLFKYLPIEELNNARLVCRLWDEKICEILRKSWTDIKTIELFKKFDQFEDFQNDMEGAGEKRIFCAFYATLDNFISFSQEFFNQHQPKLLKVNLYPGPGQPTGHFNGKPTRIEDLLTLLKWTSGSLRELTIKGFCGCNNFIYPDQKDDKDCDFIDLDFDLPHLEKMTISLRGWNLRGRNQSDIMMTRVFSGIVKKAPNLKSLKLYRVPTTGESGVFIKNLKSNKFLSKLQDFEISYDFNSSCDNENDEDIESGTQRIGPMDLIEMQKNGLENLKTFHLKLNFYKYKAAKLGRDFHLISKFLQGQSSQLQLLELDIGVVKSKSDIFKINLPNLPKLRQLNLENQGVTLDSAKNFPYGVMDLSVQFPALHEIHLGFRISQEDKFSSWDWMFTGSSQTVEILRLSIFGIFWNNIDHPPSFLPLENLFPNVKKFEVDEIIRDFGDNGKIPWENTLETFSIIVTYSDFEDLDFGVFLPFRGLQRIEITNGNHAYRKNDVCRIHNSDIESFDKLEIKSLKIHHFLLYPEVVEYFHSKCIFDYSPEKPGIDFTNYVSDED